MPMEKRKKAVAAMNAADAQHTQQAHPGVADPSFASDKTARRRSS